MIEEESFESIPMSMWWSAITMTTVGYGDLYPKRNGFKLFITIPTEEFWTPSQSEIAKTVAAFCSITGVLTLSLPLPAVVHNFQLVGRYEALEANRHRLLKAKGMTTEVKTLHINYNDLNYENE